MIILGLLGWLRGGLKLAGAFLALLVSGLLAVPLHPLTGWLVEAFGAPELLVPLFATFCTGLLLFLILSVLFSVGLKKRFPDSEEPEWNKPLGALLGGVWGMVLVVLIFTGLSTIARVDRSLREAVAINDLRTAHRLKVEKRVTEEMAYLRGQMAPETFRATQMKEVQKQMRGFEVKPEQVEEKIEPGPLDDFQHSLESFPLEGVVQSFAMVDRKGEELLRDLTVVVGDPYLLHDFQKHPTVKELMTDQTVRDLTSDPEIAKAVREKRFRELLDHPKLVKAARDESVRVKFGKVDIEMVLQEVMNGEQSR